jgi:hypothetical protein
MKRANMGAFIAIAAVSGVIGSQLSRSTKGTFVGGVLMWLVGLAIVGFIGFAIWSLMKNKSVIKASPEEKKTALQFVTDPTQGVIYIYRNQYMGLLAGMDVILDGAFIGQTRGYCFYRLVVAPGTHVFSGAKSCQNTLSVEIGAGQIAYVEQEVVVGAIKGGYQYNLINDINKAQAGVRNCKLLLTN